MLKEENELKQVEASLEGWYEHEGHGYPTKVSKANIVALELKRRNILDKREATQRLRTTALWLSKGDESSKKIHRC